MSKDFIEKQGADMFNSLAGMLKGASEGNSEWWNTFHYPETPKFDVNDILNCARSALFARALSGGPPVLERYLFATFEDKGQDEVISIINDYIAEASGQVIYKKMDCDCFLFFVLPNGAVSVHVEGNCLNGCVVSTSEEELKLADKIESAADLLG